MLYIFDSTEKLIATLPKGSFFKPIHREVLNGENAFQFSFPGNQDDAQYIIEGNLVGFRDLDAYWQIFEVKRLTDTHGDGLTRTAYCEHILYELLDDIVTDKRPSSNATAALAGMLEGTRWQAGIVDDLGASSASAYYESALSAVQKVANAWQGELNWRIIVSGNQITARYVDLLAMRGTDTGKQFAHSKDIVSIEREAESSEIVTALYGRGKGVETESGEGYGRRLTFADIETPDKPAGQEWIGNDDALARWGRNGRHRFDVFVDEDETDPEVLLEKTRIELTRRTTPRVTYKLDVVSLEQISGYEHERVRLGDLVRVIDREFKPELIVSARVIELERDLLSPENTKVVLGSFAPTIVEANINVERKVYDIANKPYNTKWFDGVIDVLQNAIENSQAYIWETPQGTLHLNAPTYEEATEAMLLGGGRFAIANQKDGQGGWNWRTFGDGSGFTADLLNAGRVRADLVEIGAGTTFEAGYDPTQISSASMGVDSDCTGLWHFDGSLNSHKGVAADSDGTFDTGCFGQALRIATGKHLKVTGPGAEGTVIFRAKNLSASTNGSVLVDAPQLDNSQGLRAGIASDGRLYAQDLPLLFNYAETTQADFSTGILTDVVATSAGDLELRQDKFADNCTSITGWTAGGEGTPASDGSSFYASAYGTGTGFHGPALTKSLGLTANDITCVFDVTWLNDVLAALGTLKISLLDASNSEVAYIAFNDSWGSSLQTQLTAYAGGTLIFNSMAGTTYNSYSGTLKLVRSGSTWTFYTGNTLLGTLNGGTTTTIAQIKLLFQQYGTYAAVTTMKVNDINITTPYKSSGSREKVIDLSPVTAVLGSSLSFDKTDAIQAGTFTRASVAYKEDGTQAAAGVPRYKSGKFGNGVHMEEGTTNLLSANQSSIETDTTGLAANGAGTTIERDTTEHWHGSASLKVVTAANTGYGFLTSPYTTITGGQPYTASVYLKGSGIVTLQIQERNNGTYLRTTESTPITLTGEWQRVFVTATIGIDANQVLIFVQQTTAVSNTFWADGLQIEQKAYATSWQIGGTPRVADSLYYTLPNALPSEWFASGVWIPDQDSTISRTNGVMLFAPYYDINNRIQVYFNHVTGVFTFRKVYAGTSLLMDSNPTSFSAGDTIEWAVAQLTQTYGDLAAGMHLWYRINSGSVIHVSNTDVNLPIAIPNVSLGYNPYGDNNEADGIIDAIKLIDIQAEYALGTTINEAWAESFLTAPTAPTADEATILLASFDNTLNAITGTVKVEAALSTDGGATYGAYQKCTSGQAIPGIPPGIDLSNARIKLKESLNTYGYATPQLHSLSFSIKEKDAITVYGPSKSTLNAWDMLSLAWKVDRLSLVVNDSEAAYIENPGLPAAFGSYLYIGSDRNSANAINTLVDELRLDRVYKDAAIRTAWYKTGTPFYTSEDMKQWPGYLKAESDGIKVYDSSNVLRVLLGSWLKSAVRKYGLKVIGGEIYATVIQSGEEGATSYIRLGDIWEPLEVVENGKRALNIWSSGGGMLQFYDTALDQMVAQLSPVNISGSQGLQIKGRDTAGNDRDLRLMGRYIRIHGYPPYSDQWSIYLDGHTFVTGNLTATGDIKGASKQAIQPTDDYGIRIFTAIEAPEHLYSDRGMCQLVNGECIVSLDHIFLECVEPDTEETPWDISINVRGKSNAYVTEVGTDYFKVEDDGGASNDKFTWRLEAVRKNYAGIRMPEEVI